MPNGLENKELKGARQLDAAVHDDCEEEKTKMCRRCEGMHARARAAPIREPLAYRSQQAVSHCLQTVSNNRPGVRACLAELTVTLTLVTVTEC
ncbi:hypothetical protein RRG08_066992 [Elysia crispata]|uniref:Uncharacterized protein n=1 Tax=Elysia crispata TaxID=231223 RepID=A0AAE0ZB61_9GAST|nr:hypothetical protein RRG08_066992 [Elysia crispata]